MKIKEEIREKIEGYIARGAEQSSRKYRMISIPPELPEGKTWLDLLRERSPVQWEGLNKHAMRLLMILDRAECAVTLTFEEFNAWLFLTGRKTRARPPEPYETWAEYWSENDKHPKGVRREEDG